MSTASAPLFYRIADIEVDPLRGCLRRAGEEVHLKPKPFQILLYLLANRERLVTREELLDRFWKDVAVTDDAIAQCIAEVRRILGDTPRNSLYLKTVPKRGYRFVGEVEEVHHLPVEIEPVAIEQVTTTTVQIHEEYIDDTPVLQIAAPPSRTRRIWLIGVAAAVLLATGVWLWSSRRLSGHPPPAGKRQVAVLRFQNRSGQPELDWLREGLPDMLTTAISRSRGLDVLSREQMSLWHGDSGESGLAGALAIARRSHIEAAVLGAFARLGESIRIDVRVYDVRTGRMLAAEGITAEKPEQILQHLDFLGGRLATKLSPGTAADDRHMLSTLKTNNLEAYRYYSVGMEKADGLHTAEAIESFQKAVSLDPNFAMAYARIGYAYAVTDSSGAQAVPYLDKAFRMADKLSEKDRRHISAWHAIANQDYQSAIRAYSEIIAAYPNETEAYHRQAILLRGESRHEEAAQILRQAQAVDPEDPTLYNAASVVYSEMGRHEEAIRMGERYSALAPGDANAYDTLALAYHWAGVWDRAEAAFNRALALKPGFEIAAMHRAILYRHMGRERESLEEFLRRARTAATAKERSRHWSYAAWHYWRRGEMAAGRAAMANSHREWPHKTWNPMELSISQASVRPELAPIPGRGSRFGLREQYFYLAQEDRLQHRPEQMLAHLREALRYKAMWSNPETLEDALADAYLEMGRLDEAIAEYERALKLFPGMARARFHLAQAEFRRGREADVKVHMRQFLEQWKQADPDLPELREARRLSGR